MTSEIDSPAFALDMAAASAPAADLAMTDLAVADLVVRLARAESEAASLRLALESNRRTGAACGVLMATLKITNGEAFDRLRIVSQHSRRKLIDVADEVLLTGALPTC